MNDLRLSPEDIEAIVDQLAARMIAYEVSPVLTEQEALALTKYRSIQSLNRWQRKFGDCRCGNGRFSRAKVLRALEKEARLKGSRSGRNLRAQ